MRVSNIGLSTTAILGMQRAARAVEAAQHQTQSGRRVERASDDPNAAASIMSASSSLRALTQYSRNISAATLRIDGEEAVLDQIAKALERAKQLGIQEGSSTANAQTRTIAKAEVDQILAFVIQLANTKHEGEYLFGGDQSGAPPITQSTPPFATAVPVGQRRAELSEGMVINVNHNATQVFLNAGTLAALDALSTALGADDQVGIQASINTVDGAIGATQQLLGEVGGLTALLETTQQNIAAVDTTLKTFKSGLEDVDLEEAMTTLVSRQNAYQASLLTTSRIMSLSLADYLR